MNEAKKCISRKKNPNYKNTDKLVSRTNHNDGLSEDQNTLTMVTVWKDEDTFDEWVADEKVAAWKAKRKTYQDSVSIEKTEVSKDADRVKKL